MAKVPPILYISSATQLLPCVAWALSRPRTRAGAALAIGGVIGAVGDMVSRWMALRFGNNNLVTYIDAPLMTICFLAALREWQLTARERRAFAVGSILFLLSCLGLVAFVEDINKLNFGVGPLGSLSLLAGGIWTLLRRTGAVERTPVLQTDWFWVASGLALQGGATALASPLGGFLLEHGRIDLFMIIWQVRAIFVVTSYLLISWGIYRGHAVSKFETVG